MTRITLLTAGVTADLARRTLTGTVYRYGEVGATTGGPLAVAPSLPAPPFGLGMTLEHDRGVVRGHIALVDNTDERLRVSVKVLDGPLGDAALAEATSVNEDGRRVRAGFSFDLEDVVVEDGHIVSGRWEALGQVAEPAYNSARIDQIAASTHPKGKPMRLTEQQRARLAELRALDNLTDEQRDELRSLVLIEAGLDDPATEPPAADPAPTATTEDPAPQAVAAAAVPAVPGGVPRPTHQPSRTSPAGGHVQHFVDTVADALRPGGGGAQAITAAFSDVTSTSQTPNIETPAWSGELWSGVQFEPVFTPLFSSGNLTDYDGVGWRWVTKPAMADWAGDKTAVPSGAISTAQSTYEAARMAVGHDFDRKFVDFDTERTRAFLRSYMEAVREDWAAKLDAKVEAHIVTEAQTVANQSGVAPGTSMLASLAKLIRYAKRQRLGNTLFVVLSDADYDRLWDITKNDLPAFLEMSGLSPERIVSSSSLPADLAVVGAKQAATVRTLPGSPIRVDAQHLANGGIDKAFFGYWAIEEHHDTGVVSMDLGFAV